MATLNSDIAAAVKRLRGQVSEKRYDEAIQTLKQAGGETGAFAAMYAGLVAAWFGTSVGMGVMIASLSNPIAIGAAFVTGVSISTVGLLLGAEKINSMYESMDSTQRQALTEVIAYGVEKVWAIRKFWKIVSRGT